MRFYLVIFFIFIYIKIINSQIVIVIDDFSKMPLSSVKVFSLKTSDTLETNLDGEVNIDIFPNDDIIFFYYPYFKITRISKEDIIKQGNTIFLERTNYLKRQALSKLNAKEYSGDLPFYTQIVNTEEDLLGLDYQGVKDKILFRTNNGGMSIFRGLEPHKTLLAIDGMRLNNAIYRNGKIETTLNFNKTTLDRIEQIYAPSFLFYSPDAIGGVIQYFTKLPQISIDYPIRINTSIVSQYETATNSKIYNLQTQIATYHIASTTSITYGNYGTITMGKNRKYVPQDDPYYALNLFYVDRLNQKDTMIQNPNPYKQLGTDYKQLYLLQKLRFKISDNLNILINLHYTTTSDIGIYSGLTEINGDHLRFAQCKFMPQNKYILQFQTLYNVESPISSLISVNSYYLFFNEYRLTRKFQNPIALHQIEKLNKYAINLDVVKIYNINRLTYGLYAYKNTINSNAFFENIITGQKTTGLTRYPTKGSFAYDFGAYINFKILQNSQFIINTTLRYDYNITQAYFDTTKPQLPLNFTSVKYDEGYPTASISLDAYPLSWLQWKIITSAARRHPIIDDFGKVMVKDFIISIPTNNLKDEKDFAFETGINIYNKDNSKIYTSAFYTIIKDAIVLKDTTLNNKDTIYFGIDPYQVATKINIPNALIYGFSAGFNHIINFFDNPNIFIKINASFNYIKGYQKKTKQPLPNIPPYFGSLTITAKYKNINLKFWNTFNGPKPYKELSPVGEDYIEKASSTGFLPWNIYNCKINFKYKNFEPAFAVYNIFDLFYKMYGTPIAGTGRNFVFTLKINLQCPK